MLYTLELTVPAATPEDEPVEASIEIEEAWLVRVSVRFLAGCNLLVYAAVYYGIDQVLPSTAGAWISGEDEEIVDYPMLRLPETPCKLTVKAYAPATAHDHLLKVRFLALEDRWVRWMLVVSGLLDMLRRLLRRVGLI